MFLVFVFVFISLIAASADQLLAHSISIRRRAELDILFAFPILALQQRVYQM